MKARTSAFTLVELLVVIAIITILMATMLPALANSRKLAKRTACGANLHSIYITMATYANEYESKLPNPGNTTTTNTSNDSTMVITYDMGNSLPSAWYTLWSQGYFGEKKITQSNLYSIPGQLLPKGLQCPSMDWTSLPTSGANGNPIGHYDYRNNFSKNYGSVTLINDGYQNKILLNDAAANRIKSGKINGISTGSAVSYFIPQRWAHEEGGNVATYNGAVFWVPNKITVGQSANPASGSWPTDDSNGTTASAYYRPTYSNVVSNVEYGIDRLTK